MTNEPIQALVRELRARVERLIAERDEAKVDAIRARSMVTCEVERRWSAMDTRCAELEALLGHGVRLFTKHARVGGMELVELTAWATKVGAMLTEDASLPGTEPDVS